MRHSLAVLAAGFAALVAGQGALAAQSPVVVELFTSQGCSSCPPADEELGKLADEEDVIALALHVDYWDYMGWKDSFGSPVYTNRQRAYARAAGQTVVYTPQMVVDGTDHIIGNKPAQLSRLIRAHGREPEAVDISLEREGSQVSISAVSAKRFRGEAMVQLLRYIPSAEVAIRAGENAGKTLRYSNIVKEIETLARWDGRAPLRLVAEADGDEAVVVLVQETDHGPILGAARLR